MQGGQGASLFSQQECYLQHNKDMRDPLLVFDQDLEHYIKTCHQQEEAIILMSDFNADVLKGKIRKVSTNRGLTEVILQRHGLNPPATHERNNNRIPIDGMFGSASINILTGGYLGFKEAFDSDHRTLWTSVEEKGLLGFKRDGGGIFADIYLLGRYGGREFLNILISIDIGKC